MYGLKLKVSEHVLMISTGSQRIRNFFMSPPWSKFILANEDVDEDLSLNIEFGYGRPFVDFVVASDAGPQGIRFHRADYRIKADLQLRRAEIGVYDEFALKHALMNVYSSYIVHKRWGLLLHSSCVAHKDHAFLFAGHSGAGKSTAARLSSPRPVLSDEASILKIRAGEVTVFDSPFRSELVTPEPQTSRRLSAIHLLLQAAENRRIRLKTADAMFQTLDKIFYWPHDGEDSRQTFLLCKMLAEAVPIYHLYFKQESTFWEEIS